MTIIFEKIKNNNEKKFKSNRLKLRQWINSDLPIFAQLNADPKVMQYYPNILKEKESNKMAKKLMSLISDKGWGLWAVEKTDTKEFIGFVGLNQPSYNLPVSPCIEIGWRLASKYWGKGYASEAAKIALEFAFNKLDLSEVYSFTSVINEKSIAVMERIGMKDTFRNFKHPMLSRESELSEHVLYKITREQSNR